MDGVLRRLGQVNNTAHLQTQHVLMRSLKTCIEMLQDRGYTSIQACQTVEEVQQNMLDAKPIVCGYGPAALHVFFHGEERVGVKQLRSGVASSSADWIVIVSLDGPTAFTRKEAEAQHPHVQFFGFKDVCVNVTKHELVPRHRAVEYSDHPADDLPVLLTTDKVCQYYAFAPGTVVEVTRTAGVQTPTPYYRIVKRASGA